MCFRLVQIVKPIVGEYQSGIAMLIADIIPCFDKCRGVGFSVPFHETDVQNTMQ